MFHRFFFKRSLLTVLLVLLLLLLAAGGWFVYQGRQLYQSAASVTPIAALYDTISSRTHYAAYDQLPQTFVQAVICTEDRACMTHKGIDPGAISGAAVRSAHPVAGRGRQHPHPAAGQERPVHAGKAADPQGCRSLCGHRHGKGLLKTADLRDVCQHHLFRQRLLWHRGSRRGLLGKTAAELTDAEAVYLAGLPNAPSAYASNPELALKRAQVVLKRMVKCRVFTQQQADEVAAEVAALPILQ